VVIELVLCLCYWPVSVVLSVFKSVVVISTLLYLNMTHTSHAVEKSLG
jgi:hypothetical protein